MKKNFLLLLMGLGLINPYLRGDNPPPQPPKDVTIDPIKPPSGKPRTPGYENEVKAYIHGNILTINFDEPEGTASVTLNEYGIDCVYYGTHSTEAPIVISVPSPSTPTQILISTQYGNSYEGWIQ